MAASFGKDLWDGFDGVCQHMQLVRDNAKKLIDFFDERTKLEHRYAKEMQALVKKHLETDDMPTLNTAWEAIRHEAEVTATAVEAFANEMQTVGVKGLNEWRDSYKKMFHGMENDGAALKKAYAAADANHDRAQKNYIAKCKAADKSHAEMLQLQGDKQVKAQQKVAEATKIAQKADADYKTAVEQLHEAKNLYDQKMSKLLNEMQQAEMSRLSFMRDAFNKVALGAQQKGVALLEESQDTCAHAGNIDTQSDVQNFIASKKSGRHPHEHVVYLPIDWIGSEKLGGELPPNATLRSTGGTARSRSPSPAPQSRNSMPEDNKQQSPVAASVAPEKKATAAASSADLYVAQFAYAADGDNELTIAEGDVIEVTDTMGDSGWYAGKIVRSGKSGIFPAAYVEKQQASAAAGGGGQKKAAPAAAPVTTAASSHGKCQAIYAYEATGPDELSIAEGDVLEIVAPENSGWIYGTNSRGETGMFPSSYVQPL
eukprot:TRINITY_DN87_c0_g1_i1.p1 TRINITY_DN87_c0_g1~~TRINITY_DN87_c0_g1_i1.p1  ORF type:complete len:485 (+),score=133.24 TRINITY_DN87_c0_g1_i1:40-1494(+)